MEFLSVFGIFYLISIGHNFYRLFAGYEVDKKYISTKFGYNVIRIIKSQKFVNIEQIFGLVFMIFLPVFGLIFYFEEFKKTDKRIFFCRMKYVVYFLPALSLGLLWVM